MNLNGKSLLRTIILPPNGSVEVIKTSIPLTLEEYQHHVGGPIEIVPCAYGGKICDMIINEEGKGLGLHPNYIATRHFKQLKEHGYEVEEDYIAGTALILTNYDLP